MDNSTLVFKVLRYLAQTAVIYLLLRYLPFSNLDTQKSVVGTVVVIVVIGVLECLCTMRLSDQSEQESGILEKFGISGSCTSCGDSPSGRIEGFEEEPKSVNANGRCRIVCEEPVGNNKSNGSSNGSSNSSSNSGSQEELRTKYGEEPFDEEVRVQQSPQSPQSPQSQEVYPEAKAVDEPMQRPTSQPVNDDRYYWGSRYGNMGYDKNYGFGGMFYDEYPFYNRYRNNDIDNLRNTGDAYPGSVNSEEDRQREIRRLKERAAELERRAHSIGPDPGWYQETGDKSEKLKTIESRRRIEGELDDELPYSDYNHLPVASGYKSHAYEYGYSFLPPEKWYGSAAVRPPICVTERSCPVNPVLAQGTPADVKEWHSARRITPPDLINTDYIGEKLNAGR